ncbi:MAG: family 14 glycosylhydrolase [Reinekea sp.]
MNKRITLLTLSASIALASASWASNATSANVMAPLEVNDWNGFQQHLNTAKSMGVSAVSVDVWWGKVESSGDQSFDWSYYDTVFNSITNAGLHIVPIMSFHQCGGNVGDDCNIPLPGWIWNKYSNQGVSVSDLKYKSEYGNESTEVISLWADQYVLSQYQEFMEAFEAHFANKADVIDEINVSMGASGELRYPSYNTHDNDMTGYPTRGGFQSYSTPAVEDFRNWAVDKYGSLNAVASAWGISLSSTSQINPPSDAGTFIYNADHFNTQYGRDFVRWYHDSLIHHGQRMMDTALVALDGAFTEIELGYKIPGVHWKMSANDNSRRSAEIAAGLIPSDVDLNSPGTGHGYADIVGLAASYADEPRGVTLHFTALEMDDNPNSGESLAKSLVFWVANAAEAQKVTIKGENALAGGVTSDHGWDNIINAFSYASYSGMTVLRINQVTTGSTGQNRYTQFINDFLVTTDPNEDWQRTVVFLYGQTSYGQDMFVRGGIDHNYANSNLGKNCQTYNVECAIPIRHRNLLNSTTSRWKTGDNYLDWYGAESDQDSYSVGTPLDWTTNNSNYDHQVSVDGYGYSPLNTFGEHYWMLDVDMDCSKTVNSWFELKSYISNGPGWEGDVSQPGAPYYSNNHFAQCGKLNVFVRGSNNGIIGSL